MAENAFFITTHLHEQTRMSFPDSKSFNMESDQCRINVASTTGPLCFVIFYLQVVLVVKRKFSTEWVYIRQMQIDKNHLQKHGTKHVMRQFAAPARMGSNPFRRGLFVVAHLVADISSCVNLVVGNLVVVNLVVVSFVACQLRRGQLRRVSNLSWSISSR